jgi:hypothetical protein
MLSLKMKMVQLFRVEVHTAYGNVKDVKVDAITGKVAKINQDGQDENGNQEENE